MAAFLKIKIAAMVGAYAQQDIIATTRAMVMCVYQIACFGVMHRNTHARGVNGAVAADGEYFRDAP